MEYENGTEANQMSKSISQNALNKFTIHISQAVVNESDFGIYHLKLWNSFGEITVIVNVIPQSEYYNNYYYNFCNVSIIKTNLFL